MSELALRLIAENKITKAPFLDLGNCGLVNYLPEELLDCVWLTGLNLGINYYDETQNEWIKTKNKSRKNVFDGQELYVLWELSTLKVLFLESVSVLDYRFLKKMITLESLYLCKSQILDFSVFDKLINLKALDISDSQLSDIDFLGRLINLQTLFLGYNRISDIRVLEKLSELKTLDLSNNQISDIEPLKKLSKLEALNLRSNRFTDILCLGELSNLRVLDLHYNNVSDIKPLVPLLRQGVLVELEKPKIGNSKNKIGLHQNPVTNPPFEILKMGSEAIIRYFERLELEGKDYIHEAKLTLVGDGGAGKTSLQRKILDENAELPNGDDRTRGIKIYDWTFLDRDKKKYVVHIWDFGGQDVYYPVHRFFLTENSVYILMASTRFSNHNFDYWIPTIYQFGGKSPIVLVQNCDNGNQKSWEDIGIYYSMSDYNICKPFYKIDLKRNGNWGLKPLMGSIEQQIVNLPHIGKPVPKSWVKVRELLVSEAQINDCISYEKFTELCEKIEPKAFLEVVDIEDLGRFLHDLGIILWYSDKELLKNLVVLNPDWAMNAVYKIIDDATIQEQYGIIHKIDFERIWHESTYRNRIGELKLMLEVFKIAFPKKHQKNDFVIPARLPSMDDKYRWRSVEQYLRIEYHFDFMPKGIINQISAELSKIIISDNCVWSNAVIFKNDGSEAQVIEEHHLRKILIKAKGRDARGLLMLIMHTTSNIVSEYRGVVPLIKVPCNCNECEKSEKPTIFEYNDLLEYLITKNREYVTCNQSDTRQNISSLLYSIGFDKYELIQSMTVKDERFMATIQTDKTSEIFFSYSWDKEGETESREQIVRELYRSLKEDNFNVILDKQDLAYRESISEFMKRIGRGKIVVVAISDAYLKSIYCMYEFYEIYKNALHDRTLMRERIFPIRIEAIALSKPSVLDEYFDYWENLEKEWEDLITKRGTRIGESQQRKYRQVKAIASELGDFLDFLSDMNSKSKEILSKDNFAEIKNAIIAQTKA